MANISFETTVDAAGNPRYQNTHLQIIQYARSKLISIEDALLNYKTSRHRCRYYNTIRNRFKIIQRRIKYG